jgi:N6-adenosine-specific RNA methylase IME4
MATAHGVSTFPQITIDAELKSLIRPLTTEEYSKLEISILRDGIREPLAVWDHKDKTILLDGHNRKQICDKHGVTYKTLTVAKVTIEGESLDLDSMERAWIWVAHNQGSRRNLDSTGWAILVARVMPAFSADAKRRQEEHGKTAPGKPKHLPNELGKCSDATSKHLGEAVTQAILSIAPGKTNKTYVQAVLKEGGYKDGVITKPEKLEKLEMASDGGKGRVILGLIRSQRNLNTVARLNAITTKNATKLPAEKEYSVLYVDCPWKYEFAETDSRKIENQYETMTVDELCEYKVEFEGGKKKSVNDIAAKDAVIFFWATAPKSQEAHRVLEAWGFEYKTHAVWDKEKIGMGYWFRGQHELLMVATKGKMPVPEEQARVSSVIRAVRGAHSAKPEQVYSIIEQMYPEAARAELFSRNRRPGWDAVGNQLAQCTPELLACRSNAIAG